MFTIRNHLWSWESPTISTFPDPPTRPGRRTKEFTISNCNRGRLSTPCGSRSFKLSVKDTTSRFCNVHTWPLTEIRVAEKVLRYRSLTSFLNPVRRHLGSGRIPSTTDDGTKDFTWFQDVPESTVPRNSHRPCRGVHMSVSWLQDSVLKGFKCIDCCLLYLPPHEEVCYQEGSRRVVSEGPRKVWTGVSLQDQINQNPSWVRIKLVPILGDR